MERTLREKDSLLAKEVALLKAAMSEAELAESKRKLRVTLLHPPPIDSTLNTTLSTTDEEADLSEGELDVSEGEYSEGEVIPPINTHMVHAGAGIHRVMESISVNALNTTGQGRTDDSLSAPRTVTVVMGDSLEPGEVNDLHRVTVPMSSNDYSNSVDVSHSHYSAGDYSFEPGEIELDD